MDNSKNPLHENNKLNTESEADLHETGQKQLLYFDHARIRHMERMFDLFLTLFKRK